MDTNPGSTGTPQLDIGRIMEMIPHRYPFLMVDRVIDIVEGTSAVGIKCVSINEPFFQGHFPGHPVMPGVLVVEAMAQTAAVLVVQTLGKDTEGKLVYFTAIDMAKFRKPIQPGDTIHIHVVKERSRGNLWRFKGEAKVDGALMAEAVFAAIIMDR